MSNQSEYQSPLVEPEKRITKVWKSFTSGFEILKHGLIPHQNAQLPKKQFEASHFTSEAGYLFDAALEMYRESTKRIDGLEEKGFRLLTYISAVSAILIYFLSKDISGLYKFFVILSLFCLTVAIIISLRCISIKYQKVLFIDSLFTFKDDSEPASKDKKTVTAEIINCTVYNQTVADNTADILRAARIMLSYGIVTTIISCIFFLSTPSGKLDNKIYQTKVTLADSVFKSSIISLSQKEKLSMDSMKKEVKLLRLKLDSLSGKLPSKHFGK